MSDKFRAGEAVEWNSHGGIARGKVTKKLTSRTTLKGHQVDAAPDNPDALAEADGGGQAAGQPQAQPRRGADATGR